MNDMKVLPQMFRSTPTGRLLTDQQVPLKWCRCGCGEAISVNAEGKSCSIQDCQPAGGGTFPAVDWDTGEVL